MLPVPVLCTSASHIPHPKVHTPKSTLGPKVISILIDFAPFVDASASHTSYLNASTEETIELSTPKYGIKNYPASFAWQWFLIVPEGRQVQITFEAFELEQSEHCENDYLEIREAYVGGRGLEGKYGAILSKPVCGSTKPSTIQSAGNMVWVQFKSDSNTTTTYKGFKASFTAGMFRRHHSIFCSFVIVVVVVVAVAVVFFFVFCFAFVITNDSNRSTPQIYANLLPKTES